MQAWVFIPVQGGTTMLTTPFRIWALCAGLLLPTLGLAAPAQPDSVQAAIDWAQQQPLTRKGKPQRDASPLIIASRPMRTN